MIHTLTVKLNRWDFEDWSPDDQSYGQAQFFTTNKASYGFAYAKDGRIFVKMQDRELNGWATLDIRMGKIRYAEWVYRRGEVHLEIDFEAATVEIIFPRPA